MEKNNGKIWECKTRFTFYLSNKDEKKLINKKNDWGNHFQNSKTFKDFNLFLLDQKELINFFKIISYQTFHNCEMIDYGSPIKVQGGGLVGDKQKFNKLTHAYELPKKPETNSKQLEFPFPELSNHA